MSRPWKVHERDPRRTVTVLLGLRSETWIAYCGDPSPELQRAPLAGRPTCRRCARVKAARRRARGRQA